MRKKIDRPTWLGHPGQKVTTVEERIQKVPEKYLGPFCLHGLLLVVWWDDPNRSVHTFIGKLDARSILGNDGKMEVVRCRIASLRSPTPSR